MKNTQEVDLYKILMVLAKHKKFIFWTTLLISICAVVYSLVIPQYWISTTTILPVSESSGTFSLGSSNSFMGIGSSLLGNAVNTESYEYMIILHSREFSKDIIDKFDLINYMEIEAEDELVVREKALKRYNEKIKNIALNDDTGLITISIETKDKFLSTKIANYYSEKLENYNLTMRKSKGRQKRIFLEKRIKTVKGIIDTLSQELKEFQQNNNIIQLEEQTISLIKLYSDLLAQKTALEVKLEYTIATVTEDNPIIEQLMLEKSILEKKISELEVKELPNNSYILSLEDIPELAIQYANLKMNFEIQEQVFRFLYPQYEQAKIEEIKDLPTIEVIDKAVPAGLRSKPKRARLCILSFLLAFILSSFLSYTHEAYVKSGGSEKVKEILRVLLSKKP